MPKISFLKLALVFVAVLTVAGISYAVWKLAEQGAPMQSIPNEPQSTFIPERAQTSTSQVTPTSPPTGGDPTMNEEKVVRGLVFENNLGCERDILCYLSLRFNGEVIGVIYHHGMWPPCMNTEAARQGLELERGEEVEVFGKVVDNTGTLSTCDSSDYYIRKLP